LETILTNILVLLTINLGVAIAAVLLLWLASIPLRDVSIIDMFFAVVLFAITTVSFVIGDGVAARKQLLLLLVGLWALRITLHLVKRNWGHGEDPRYTRLRKWTNDNRSFIWLSLRKVFLLQGIVIWLVSLPVQVAQVYSTPLVLGWLAWLGTALWLVGFSFETVADYQLTRFRADSANKGTVLKTGLWKYSRHPNYFGELCVWWGLFLIACDNPFGFLTVIGPIVYTYLIINVTGQRMLDKKLANEKPEYAAYMASTSGLIPLPRKRTGSAS
jgi:steroid 5-alpha reductase family enzyme